MQVQRQSRLLRILSGLFGVRQRFPESRAIVLSYNCGYRPRGFSLTIRCRDAGRKQTSFSSQSIGRLV
jgi:hypothetical protein